MKNGRILTCLFCFALLMAATSGTAFLSNADPGPGMAPAGQSGQLGERARFQLVSARVRGIGFDIGQITREGATYLVPVTGFRSNKKVLRSEGGFKPFTLPARIEGREIVLDRAVLEAAGYSVADAEALRTMGVRVEQVEAEPPAAAPSAKVQAQAPRVAAKSKAGPIRWSPVVMGSRGSGQVTRPPSLEAQVKLQKADLRADLRTSLIKVHKRAALDYQPVQMLDPGKAQPTPIADPRQALPALPNGITLTAEDYFRELNLLEKDFNSLGYSLDARRDAEEEVLLQEIPPPPGQNGTRIRLNTTALAGGRSKAADFRSAVEAKTKRLAGLRTAQADTAAPAAGKTQGQATGVSVRKAGAAAAVRTTAQRSLEDALGDRKKAMKATAAPFKKEFNPTLLERGDRDLFAIALHAGSRLVGSVEALEIANSIGVKAYILGAGLDFLTLFGTTSAPAGGGDMLAELGLMVLGDSIPGATIRETRPVPAAPLSENAGLPPVGGAADWSVTVDQGFGTGFSAGPVPLSLRIGARATLGLEYTVLASPLRVENEIAPYASASVYGQAGAGILIVETGVICDFNLLDTRVTVHGMLQRGAEDGKEFLDTEYFINRWHSSLAGEFSVYASVYVPRWGLPPWKKKTYKSVVADWSGWSDDLWEPALTKKRHYLFIYPGTTAAVLAGYNY